VREEGLAYGLSVPVPQFLTKEGALESAPNHPREHDRPAEVEPDDVCCPRPKDAAYDAVVAINDPLCAGSDFFHRL
jgi:hypothetical protein